MVAAALLASPAMAQQSNEQLGREIAAEADRRDLGWGDNASVMRMILRNRNGDESVRELRRQVLETNEEGRGGQEPPYVRRAARRGGHFAAVAHEDPRARRPVALPAGASAGEAHLVGEQVGAVRGGASSRTRISPPRKSTSTAIVSCARRRAATWNASSSSVSRGTRHSGYTRQVVWWDKDEYRVQRIDFYDRKDSLLKTLAYHGYQQYLGRYWRPDLMTMENRQNGKSTDLVFAEWTFANGLNEGKLTPSRLRRAR